MEASSDNLIGYLRVSTSEQADSRLGLEAQREAIIQAATLRGYNVVAWEVDAGVSGMVRDRAGLLRAFQYVEQGFATGIVASHLSRFSRNSFHLMEMMQDSENRGWRFVALDLNIDTSTPMGKFTATVMSAMVQFVRDQISANTKEALAAKKARGEPIGRPTEITDETRDMIYGMVDGGLSQSAVAKALTMMGVPTPRGGDRWNQSTIAWIIKKRRETLKL